MTLLDAQRTRTHLFRVESLRLRRRGLVRWLVLVAIVLYVVTVAVAAVQYARPDPAEMAQARAQRAELLKEIEQGRQECISSLPSGQDAQEACGPAPSAADLGALSNYFEHPPFDLAELASPFAIGFALGWAALLFLIGTTFIGAEWSQRTMAAWVTWHPNRWRVAGAKAAVVTAFAVGSAVVLQALWLVSALLLAATKGVSDVPAGFWGELLATQGRSVLFCGLAGLGGVAMGLLVRSTGAVLGIAFLWFAVLENLVRVLEPSWQRWLLTDNALGLLQPAGWRIVWFDSPSDEQPQVFLLMHWSAGLFLATLVVLVLAVGGVLFRRRDLT